VECEDYSLAKGQDVAVAQRAKTFKPDLVSTLTADGKEVSGQERGFVHEAVRIVIDAIDSAALDRFTWLEGRQTNPPGSLARTPQPDIRCREAERELLILERTFGTR